MRDSEGILSKILTLARLDVILQRWQPRFIDIALVSFLEIVTTPKFPHLNIYRSLSIDPSSRGQISFLNYRTPLSGNPNLARSHQANPSWPGRRNLHTSSRHYPSRATGPAPATAAGCDTTSAVSGHWRPSTATAAAARSSTICPCPYAPPSEPREADPSHARRRAGLTLRGTDGLIDESAQGRRSSGRRSLERPT